MVGDVVRVLAALADHARFGSIGLFARIISGLGSRPQSFRQIRLKLTLARNQPIPPKWDAKKSENRRR
jgi:hypothetical protein